MAFILLKQLIEAFDVDMDDAKQNESKKREHAVAFTARLMALYRSQENKLLNPLIIDPFADDLVGDIKEYLSENPSQAKS